MCEIDLDTDGMELWSETWRVARKAHQCSSCGGPVRPGEKYVVHFSIHDGNHNSDKLCAPCHADRKEFADAHGGIIPQPYFFPEMLESCVSDGDPESDKRWRPMLDALNARVEVGP